MEIFRSMINLNEVSSEGLSKLVTIREKIEALELEMAKLVKEATKRAKLTGAVARRTLKIRKCQPKLRNVITEILRKAGKPLSVQEIYAESLAAGYVWRSQRPINALNVKIYTDKTFQKVAPGHFVLRKTPTDI